MSQSRSPKPVRLEDYRPPAYTTRSVELDFRLDPEATELHAVSELERRGEGPLVLHGRELETLAFRIDGKALDPTALPVSGEELVLEEVPDRFTLEVHTRMRPGANTALMGLYETGGLLCTQCEAEGFRRLTWFQDRPDVAARYRVRIEAERERYPVLLSNGNPVEAGRLGDGRHYAVWEDPHPKPSYLFALVAGKLGCLEEVYRTRSGRRITLRIYAKPFEVERCRHALEALELAMRWEEEVYGLEYDLDLYQIVAVEDFNFGAMENKGLNIFNAAAILADPDTATDADHLRIARIVAHEYFHNWTGNRVTLRDWFQLTLKEGLTVFRDQQFMRDLHSPGVARIDEVARLREIQFPEDEGPLRHPPRPREYVEINNFYTATVYEKGAEIVRMLHRLLGERLFRRGVRHYLRRLDGAAATVEDFLASMAAVSGRDLATFARWYEKAGTPRLTVETAWEAETGRFRILFRQRTPEGEPAAEPLTLPVGVALLSREGEALPLRLEAENAPAGTERLLVIEETERSFTFTGLAEPPVPSLLRGFSAPVRLEQERDPIELAFLFAHDDDPFCRWDAGQTLALLAMRERLDPQEHGARRAGEALHAAFARILEEMPEDHAFAARLLSLPGRNYLAQLCEPVRVDAVDRAWREVRRGLAEDFAIAWRVLYDGLPAERPYATAIAAIGRRSLRHRALSWLAIAGPEEAGARIRSLYAEADNLTERLAALRTACDSDGEAADALLADFRARFGHEPLVLDKWFALQGRREDETAVERVRALLRDPDFSWRHPNRVRALLGSFTQENFTGFHRSDGGGYRLLAEAVLAADRVNPQLAARLVQPLGRHRRFAAPRGAEMRAALGTIREAGGLSRDLGELVEKALGGAVSPAHARDSTAVSAAR